MTDLYLIAHVVRGEPAFDIATKLDIEDEEGQWWIIPTSGHRAYPYWHRSLNSLCDWHMPDLFGDYQGPPPDKAPEGWPDHYPTRSTATPPPLSSLLSLAPKQLVTRR